MRYFLVLAGLAIVGPGIAYAATQHWIDEPTTQGSLPLTFHPGADLAATQRAGFAGAFEPLEGGAAYRLGLAGLAGASIRVDNLVFLQADPRVSAYRLEVAEALHGDLKPTQLKLRFWNGAAAPQNDWDAGVCAVLDLVKPSLIPVANACVASVHVQLLLALPPDAAGAAAFAVRPSMIVAPGL